MPKWGVSKNEYFFNGEEQIVSKGLSSVKYMGKNTAEELYTLAHSKDYTYFVDLLSDINSETSVDARQLEILIKIDFFSSFGNQRELLRISEIFFDMFKAGAAKKINKEKVDGTPIGDIVKKYAVGVTKSGGVAKSYTLLDVYSILREVEMAIKELHMEDLSDVIKVRNFKDMLGYVGYVSGKEEDRRKLYVLDIYPVRRKKDKKQFGYSIITKSIGSGKESRFTVFNKVYEQDPIKKDDIIYCQGYEVDNGYFRLTKFRKCV